MAEPLHFPSRSARRAIKELRASGHVEPFGKELHRRLFAVGAFVAWPTRSEPAQPVVQWRVGEDGAVGRGEKHSCQSTPAEPAGTKNSSQSANN